jgi:FKBP-type peptidyl-prolyl cis-trans isomerase FkpA
MTCAERLMLRTLPLAAVAVTVAGCYETLTGPPCLDSPWTVASTQGDTLTTSTGLRYIEGAAGTGDSTAWCKAVAVHYDGYLLNGTKFDSSRDLARALIFTPGLGALIDGFEQGVIGLPTCATRRLIIPPQLGYGDQPVRNDSGQVIVPANSTVVFDIEVLEIFGEPIVNCDSTGA